MEDGPALRRTVALVAGLNLAYFGVEFAVALNIGSVSLLADSIDFLEDASVNTLIFIGIGWAAAARARLGMVLAGVLLIPSLWTLLAALQKFASFSVPDATPLTVTGFGALVVNLTCAMLLMRLRRHHGSLAIAAFLSARNDALANVAIIIAGVVTLFWASAWPDLIVGLGIAALNLRAAQEVWRAARAEHVAARS